jgi:hypothetical protein
MPTDIGPGAPRAPRASTPHRGRLAAGSVLVLAAATAFTPAVALAGTPAPTEIGLRDGRAIRTWTAADARGAADRYAVQRADGSWADPRELDPRIHLRTGAFDPLVPGALPAPPEALAAAAGHRLHIVQFATQWVEGYRAELTALGAEVHQHLPATARIVRMDADTAAAVAARPFVRAVVPYHPVHRVDKRILADFDGMSFQRPAARYVVRLIDPANDRPAFADAVRAIGGTIDRLDAGSLISELTLDADQLAAVLGLDQVLYVDPWGPYENDMVIARQIGGAVELETVAGYDGEGVRGEVLDGGFNTGHVDFGSRPLISHGTAGNGSHGASTSGIIFGDGTGNAEARGLLPAGQGIVADYDFTGIDSPSRYSHTSELVTSEYQAVFQSCSFGSPRTTQYTNASAQMDAMVFDFDLSIAQSQSNANGQLSRPQAWAKNAISVGGVNHQSTLSKADDRWGGASIGPAADGRIKPDLTHFYDSIFTVTGGGSTAYTSSFGGTSGATPIVAGYLGLFYDMWADGIFGNEVVPGGDVFLNRSRQSTAKAVLINTAEPYDWTVGGPNDNITRVRQGWGMPSAIAMYEQRESILVVDETEILPNLGSWTSTVTVSGDVPALRVTLTWADPPGTTSSSIHRINDLDLIVSGPGGVVYRGNVGLLAGVWSTPGGERDDRNTVENVFVPTPAAGTWTIEVVATELNEDGHLETPALDADFALVATGGTPIPPTLIVQLVDPIVSPVPAGTETMIRARLGDGVETLDPASAEVRWRPEGAAEFASLGLEPVDGEPGIYAAVIPASGCDSVDFHLAATSVAGTTVTRPSDAPAANYRYDVGSVETVLVDDGETDGTWQPGGGDATGGVWVRGVPIPGSFPTADGDGSGACWQTGLANGDDVDGGSTVLLSPVYDLSDVEAVTIRFLRSFIRFGEGPDSLVTEVTTDGGATWTEVDSVTELAVAWTQVEFPLAVAGDATDSVQLRFTATDGGADSGVEAGIDGLEIIATVCTELAADVDGDGVVGFSDLLAVLAAWGPCPASCPADVDGNGDVGFDDVLSVLAAWS